MQTSLPQRAFAHSLRTLKRARGHPRQWAPAVMPDVPLPDFAVAPVLPLPSGWAPPQGPSLALPFRVRVGARTRSAWGYAPAPLAPWPALAAAHDLPAAHFPLPPLHYSLPTCGAGDAHHQGQPNTSVHGL